MLRIEAGTGVCSVFALSRPRFSLESVLFLFCVNFTSECQSATLSRDRLQSDCNFMLTNPSVIPFLHS